MCLLEMAPDTRDEPETNEAHPDRRYGERLHADRNEAGNEGDSGRPRAAALAITTTWPFAGWPAPTSRVVELL